MSSITADTAGDEDLGVAIDPPHMAIELTWDTSTTLTLSRRDSDASRPVRGCEPLAVTAGETVTIADYEAPFGQPFRYEAVDGDGDYLISEVYFTGPKRFYVNDQGWFSDRGAAWLKHLTIPQLSMQIDLSNADSPVFKQTRTVVDVLNRRDPITLTDARRKWPTTTLDIRTWSLEESEALRRILADNSVLLLQVSGYERWGITNWYVAVGDVTEERLWQEWAPFEGRVFHLPVEIVERPVGGTLYPTCCYWARQQDMPSYLAFMTQYAEYNGTGRLSYAQLASCSRTAYIPPDPPDPTPNFDDGNFPDNTFTYNQLATVSRTDNQGTYGATTTSTTYGGTGFFTDQGNNPAQTNTPVPFVAVSKTVTLQAGNRYLVSGQLQNFRVDQSGSLAIQLRLTPGASAATGSGTLISTGTSTNHSAGDRVNKLLDNGSGSDPSFIAPGTGQYTIALVLTGTVQTVTTATDVAPTSNYYMSVNYQQATTTTTTTPANDVTLSLQTILTAGTTYYVSGTQYLKNAAAPVTFTARYVYGDATGTSPGIGFDPGTAASIGSTPVALSSGGSFLASSDGVWSIVAVVASAQPVTDGTDSAGRGAVLTIGYYS